MSMRKDKGRLPPFIPLILSTIDSPAWRATSHGAKWLYVALKRKAVSGPKAYISYRDATRELKAGYGKIREWFAELHHYGFIRLHSHGCLGVDGKGKSPHWRLTEKGQTSKASADGVFEPPPNDFLKWDGTLFDPSPYRQAHSGGAKWDRAKLKKQNPATHVGNTLLPTSVTPPLPTSVTPKDESATHVGNISGDDTATHVGNISSLTTLGATGSVPSPDTPSPPDTPSDDSRTGEEDLGQFDPKVIPLNQAKKRRKDFR